MRAARRHELSDPPAATDDHFESAHDAEYV